MKPAFPTESSIIGEHLVFSEGIWFAPDQPPISYPATGNEECFQLEDNSFWFRHRNGCITDLVKKYCPESTFLDIGGGNGYVARGLQDSGIATVLVEPGEQGARNAVGRGVQSVVCATLETSGIQPQSVEAAGLFDVIEHIEDATAFLNTVAQTLKPGGFLFLTVPAYTWLWSKEDNDAGHYRRYTLSTIRRELASAGLSTVYETYLFSALPLPIFLNRSLPHWFGRNNRSDLKKFQREHSSDSAGSQLAAKIWSWEQQAVRRGLRILTGSSCLVVARKS